MLAKFIAQKLSHIDSSSPNNHEQYILDNHLKELRDSLETSVIPLGKLRFGLYFERALLFKAIADQISLPASLVRGEYRKSWIEIACPQQHQSPTKNYLPTKLLRPNFIVDLMDNPGELIPINSLKALHYLEYKSNVHH
uniref:EDR1/CTR1/ARMC3-like peptidase-like domain-containing protein n=1 Tax=Bracon brevicornis TaxID=1563983 RepID=A0A6V7M0V3_9HYME